MTATTRTNLYQFFMQGDRPTAGQFADLIDSSLNIADTSGQFITSDVSCGGTFDVSGAFTVKNSAQTNLTGNLIVSGNATFAGTISSTSFSITTLNATTVNAVTVSAGTISVTNPATLNGGITGVTNGGDAASGIVGERVISDIPIGSAVPLTSSAVLNVAEIPLTAGDWDLFFAAQFTGDLGTTVQNMTASISNTSGTLNTAETAFAEMPGYNLACFTFATTNSILVGPFRKSISVSANVFGVATATFSVSACSVYGALVARRIR